MAKMQKGRKLLKVKPLNFYGILYRGESFIVRGIRGKNLIIRRLNKSFKAI